MSHSNKILRIMPLGDSLTRGKGGSSWRHLLKDLLRNDDIKVQYVGSCMHAPNFAAEWKEPYQALFESLEGNVAHEGWGGLMTHELIELKEHSLYPDRNIRDILRVYPADIILLMTGTNDLYNNYELENFAFRFEELLKIIFNFSDAFLFVTTVPPQFNDKNKTVHPKWHSLNNTIFNIAYDFKNAGKPIYVKNIGPTIKRKDLLSDGLHLGISGDRIIAQNWAKSLVSWYATKEN